MAVIVPPDLSLIVAQHVGSVSNLLACESSHARHVLATLP